jgi:hypothetical protein
VDNAQEKLAAAKRHYEKGDFKSARAHAKQLVSNDTLTKEARGEARKILKATGIDPISTGVFLITFCLLAYLIIKYIF